MNKIWTQEGDIPRYPDTAEPLLAGGRGIGDIEPPPPRLTPARRYWSDDGQDQKLLR